MPFKSFFVFFGWGSYQRNAVTLSQWKEDEFQPFFSISPCSHQFLAKYFQVDKRDKTSWNYAELTLIQENIENYQQMSCINKRCPIWTLTNLLKFKTTTLQMKSLRKAVNPTRSDSIRIVKQGKCYELRTSTVATFRERKKNCLGPHSTTTTPFIPSNVRHKIIWLQMVECRRRWINGASES